METQKTKSILTFILLAGVFLYAGNMAARPSQYTATRSGRSTQFLNDVAVLDSIQFDFDFINSFGNTTIKTDVYIQPITPSETGRDNPFMKSNPSAFFGDTQGISTNIDTFFDPDTPYEEEYQEEAYYEENIEPPIEQLPLDDILLEEQQQDQIPQETIPQETIPQEPQEREESQPIPPEESSSATLTR